MKTSRAAARKKKSDQPCDPLGAISKLDLINILVTKVQIHLNGVYRLPPGILTEAASAVLAAARAAAARLLQ
jgi:hypothetical protein